MADEIFERQEYQIISEGKDPDGPRKVRTFSNLEAADQYARKQERKGRTVYSLTIIDTKWCRFPW